MPIILFGKPLVLWFGVLALILFLLQILFGILMRKGHPKMFKYHKINAIVLTIVVLTHAILALILYI
jgi:dolichyl-phosphate-mannose--protein O-mannosyl transferase